MAHCRYVFEANEQCIVSVEPRDYVTVGTEYSVPLSHSRTYSYGNQASLVDYLLQHKLHVSCYVADSGVCFGNVSVDLSSMPSAMAAPNATGLTGITASINTSLAVRIFDESVFCDGVRFSAELFLRVICHTEPLLQT